MPDLATIGKPQKYAHCHGSAVPIWAQRPGLLARIVAGTLELGRADLAADNNLVAWDTVRKWLEIGHREFDQAIAADSEDITVLAQFYLEIQQAKSLFVSGRIKKIIELADSEDPELRAIYKHFHLWLAENIDETKRFSRWANMRSESVETKNVNIQVTYADGAKWTLGGHENEVLEGEIVDTTMKAIGPPPEDF